MKIIVRNSRAMEINQKKGFAISILAHLVIIAGLIIATSQITPSPKLIVVDFNILEHYVQKKQIKTEQVALSKPAPEPVKKVFTKLPAKPVPVQKKILPPAKPIPAPKTKIAAVKLKKIIPTRPLPEKKVIKAEPEARIVQDAAPEPKIVHKNQPEAPPEPVLNPTQNLTEDTAPQIAQIAHPTSSNIAAEEEVRQTMPDFPAPAAGKQKIIQSEDIVSEYTKAQFKHIQQEVQQLINYPRTARRMGWQGKVVIEFIISMDGSIKDIGIVESSGFIALDKNAVTTIKKAAPFPRPPIPAKLIIPVVYRLS